MEQKNLRLAPDAGIPGGGAFRRLAVLSLGSNLGDRAAWLAFARRRLDAPPRLRLAACSPVRETAPVGVPAAYRDVRFLNQIALVDTDLSPEALSDFVHRIEADAGRLRAERNAPRTLDIDIVSLGECVMRTPELTLPHPRARERRFVLEPLAELLPGFHFPGDAPGKTVRDYLPDASPGPGPGPGAMFDAHVHLQDGRLAGCLPEVMLLAAGAGVSAVCCCGTCPEDWPGVVRIARAAPFGVVPAFGLHPWHAGGRLPGEWLGRLERLLDEWPGAAVGEIGLDGIKKDVPPQAQEEALAAQLGLAARKGRPAVLHGARAWGRLADRMAPFAGRLPGWAAHSFGGPPEILSRLTGLGAYVSISGAVCNPLAKRVRAAAAAVPDDRLLAETDTPDIFPADGTAAPAAPPDGRPLNHPANLPRVIAAIAEIRGRSPEEIAALTAANARRLFGCAAG